MPHREVAQPLVSAPHDGTVIEVRTVEDGTWQEARWTQGDLAPIDGERSTVGYWETEPGTGWLREGEADAWRPSVAHAILGM